MSFSLTIFDFKLKRQRDIRVPNNIQLKTTTLVLQLVTNLTTLFQSPIKPKNSLNPLKRTKPIKPIVIIKGHRVRKQVVKMTIVKREES